MPNLKLDPADIIVILFTVTICAVVLAAVAKPFITGNDLSEFTVKIIAGIIGSIISIISMYVGAVIQKKSDKE